MRNIGLIFLISVWLFSCGGPMDKVTIYPEPEGLEAVNSITENRELRVTVDEQNVFVYQILDKDNQGKLSFVSFEMSAGPISFTLSTTKKIESCEYAHKSVRQIQQTDTSIVLTIDEPGKFIAFLELEGVGQQTLLVSAEMPDLNKPTAGKKNVTYLSAGVHWTDDLPNIFSDKNQQLYLEGGAVLVGNLNLQNAKAVHISGRGILLANTNKFAMHMEQIKSLHISGLTIINTAGGALEIAATEEAIVENVKLISTANKEAGLHTFGKNIQVRDIFIYSGGDRIVINGISQNSNNYTAENIHISDALLYGDNKGFDVCLSKNAQQDTRTVFIENVRSFSTTEKAFMGAAQKGKGSIYDVVLTNATFNHSKLLNLKLPTDNGAIIRDIIFDDIKMKNSEAMSIDLSGASVQSDISGIILQNVQVNGTFIHSISDLKHRYNEFAEPIELRYEQREAH